MNKDEFIKQVRGRLIVSCQALPDEPLHGPEIMVRMALAAQQGGAAAIRANSPADIRAIRVTVSLPIIGLDKDGDGGVYITPTLAHARAVAAAGADVIALDATQHPRPDDSIIASLIPAIKEDTGKLVLADVATLREGLAAQAAGADFVAPTLSGYTDDSPKLEGPDFALLRVLAEQLAVPVIAEGRIHTPAQARQALECGALAVCVGSAITRPQLITATFAKALE